MNKQQGSIHIILICGLMTLLIGGLVYVYVNRSQPVSSTIAKNTESYPDTHKLTIPVGWGGPEYSELKPGSVITDDGDTIKYNGIHTDFKSALPTPAAGMKYIKADFSIKSDSDSRSFDIGYYPTIVPKRFASFGSLMIGCADYGTYFISSSAESSVDPYSGKQGHKKRITVAGEQSYEEVYNSGRSVEKGIFYNVFVIFEVPIDDGGKISIMRPNGKNYYI